jgi:acyl dehydratase
MRTFRSIRELEDLTGKEIGVSDWIVIDQAMIDAFANVTGDHYWTHSDPERCKRDSPYGQTIAHGALLLGLITQMVGRIVEFSGDMPTTFSYGFNKIRYPAPALSGAKFHLRLGLVRIEAFDGGAQMYWSLLFEAENAPKPCLAAEWITRTYFQLRFGS